ncbi:MAG: hypothetical protein LLG20_03400 [Acidobacteriales bacterium]|nr:hypothetical protein [Terriglobales bacterium]
MDFARFVLLASLLPLAGLAQAPTDLFQKAPPEIDQALRERVTAFLQAHVDGKFRLADQYVAEDSKDAFFEAHKRRYRDFEIAKITYSNEYTKAVVLAVCGTEMTIPGQTRPMPVKMPVNMYWKTVDGKWFWYLPPAPSSYDTPFGKMKPGADNPPGAAGQQSSAEFQGPSLAQLGQLAAIDKTEVRLNPATPSAVATVVNRLPGKATVHIEGDVPEGLDAKLDRTEVNGGESAKLTVKLVNAAKLTTPPYMIRLRVDPLNQLFTVKVFVPPAQKK